LFALPYLENVGSQYVSLRQSSPLNCCEACWIDEGEEPFPTSVPTSDVDIACAMEANRLDPEVWRRGEVADRLFRAIALRVDRQSPSLDHDADRAGVRFDAGQQEQNFNTACQRTEFI
jgi:hypothetical protein